MGALAGAASPAMAQSPDLAHPNGCVSDTGYSITSHAAYFIGGSSPWKAGPGGTIQDSVTTAKTIGASLSVAVGGSAGVSIGVITATAKTDVTGTITGSVAITTGHTYTHPITAKKYGNLQFGSWGYKVGWKKWETTGSCSTITLASGTAILPTTSTGWKYWETSS